jgi:hypothetical protein
MQLWRNALGSIYGITTEMRTIEMYTEGYGTSMHTTVPHASRVVSVTYSVPKAVKTLPLALVAIEAG